MNIIFVAADFPPSLGGIQAYVSNLATELTRYDVGVHVIALDQPEAADWDARRPYPVTRISANSKWQIWQGMKTAALEHDGADVIIAAKWFPEGPAAIQAARRLDVPAALLGYDREFALHGLNVVKLAMQKWVLRSMDACLVATQYSLREMMSMSVPREKIYVLGGAVDIEHFSPDPQGAQMLRDSLGLHDRRVISTVSRLARHKGHIYVLQALQRLRGEMPDLQYVIVGEGPHGEDLRRHVEALGLEETVTFTGRVPYDELPAYYTMSDVMVMPSFEIPGEPTEGFGLTYLEAGACETPVIGTLTGGIPEAIDHGISGLLVPPKDTDALTGALRRVLSDPDYARDLGKAGRKRALRSFTWDLVARRFLAVMETVV